MYEHYYVDTDKKNKKKELTKEEFYSQIDKAHVEFGDYFTNKHKKKYGFKDEVLIREFVTYLKQKVGGNT
jgi:hypothetical protein